MRSGEPENFSSITNTQHRILGYLFSRKGEDIYQRDIETEFSIRRSTASGILQTLEKNGFITREKTSGDARLKKIILTDKSVAIAGNIEKNIADIEESLARGCTDEEIDTFLEIAEKIKKSISETLS